MVYGCPNCGKQVSKQILLKQSVRCWPCGKQIHLPENVAAGLALTSLATFAVTYHSGSYWLAAAGLLFQLGACYRVAGRYLQVKSR